MSFAVRWLVVFVSACALLVLQACTWISPQSVYEGTRDRARAESAGQAPPVTTLPDYDNYQKERERVKAR